MDDYTCTERLITEARIDAASNGLRWNTEWTLRDGESSSREYKTGFAVWSNSLRVAVTLKVFADGKERRTFYIDHFRASRKKCEEIINSKLGDTKDG